MNPPPYSWLICSDCGNVFRSDEGAQSSVVVGTGPTAESRTYEAPPYSYDPRNGCCLACWICPGWHTNARIPDAHKRN
jgi:hypothetical protein